ncbi:MAG: hypothetical protein QOG46_2124, partial [Pseudonocardiales bacterium]|nr:hypothetical protein [Pseudonocardiales bacterium]
MEQDAAQPNGTVLDASPQEGAGVEANSRIGLYGPPALTIFTLAMEIDSSILRTSVDLDSARQRWARCHVVGCQR